MAKYDYDMVIIGGGAAGLTVAAGAAQLGAKTVLIEKDRLGGDCLFYGCVPSKTLIKTAKVYHYAKHLKRFGLPEVDVPPCHLGSVMGHVQDVIHQVAAHDSVERFQGLGVDVIFGSPEFVSDHELRIHGKTLSSSRLTIATGSRPMVVPIEGLQQTGFITNIETFSLQVLPPRLAVLGAGPIGAELAHAFARLGSKVVLIDILEYPLGLEDHDMAEVVIKQMVHDGISLRMNSKAKRVYQEENHKVLVIEGKEGKEEIIPCDEILLATGRRPNVEGLNLEAAGVNYTNKGIETDLHMQTSQKHIYAAGDVNGQFPFTHMAGAEGSMIVRNAIMHIPGKINYNMTPWVIFTDPEMASIGYNEQRARSDNISYDIYSEDFEEVDRALAEREYQGKIKILTESGSNKIIGVQIVGLHAGELIGASVLALNKGMKLADLATPIIAYPTLSEIHKKSAGKYYAQKIFSPKVKSILKFFFGYQG
ncbi:MAG: FAD-dependent oxidoreductase [Deltaproteobacteria bacterium]|jgi:pyruvate/2-oxoglutarate dehydrogenase complex dihydrolipoamide dehydrogenase (E3) component